MPPTIGEVIAGRMAERFLRDYPEVTLRIVPAFSGYLLDMIQRGEADLAVMYETGATSHIHTEPLIEETLYLIGPPSSDLEIAKPVPFPGLADLSMILPGSRHGLRNLLENAAGREGIALRVSVEADALQTLKELVARGLGYTVLPLAAVLVATGCVAGVLAGLLGVGGGIIVVRYCFSLFSPDKKQGPEIAPRAFQKPVRIRLITSGVPSRSPYRDHAIHPSRSAGTGLRS